MLDTDLAELYRVPTKSLHLAVKRNADRFPEDFMFQLTADAVAVAVVIFPTHSLSNGGSFSKSGLAEMEGCIARPALWKLLTVKHAMRTLVELLRNEAEETAGHQRH